MSERGLVLVLQRLHDDPGFINMVAQDPQATLGLYDLDDAERGAIADAVKNSDNNALKQLASQVGVDWTADHIAGVGSIDDHDTDATSLYTHGDDSGTLRGDEGSHPARPAGA